MYCYRFPDRATFLSLCDTLGWTYEGSLVAYTHDRAIDEVGAIETLPGTYDEDGNELTAPVYDARHHVNLQGVHPASSIRTLLWSTVHQGNSLAVMVLVLIQMRQSSLSSKKVGRKALFNDCQSGA